MAYFVPRLLTGGGAHYCDQNMKGKPKVALITFGMVATDLATQPCEDAMLAWFGGGLA